MGKGCITATKYFLFLFNLIFFIFGALIMGFGLWVLLDNQSFIAVLQEESTTLKVASYILITVGSLSMVMGFLGCIGAIYEIRCMLGLYFTCLLLILIAQVTAGVLIYFQRDRLQQEMSTIVKGMLVNYTGQNRTTEHSWDYIQRTMKCCGWMGPSNWLENVWIGNSSDSLYSCSCRNETLPGTDVKETGLCEHLSADLPVYQTGCMHSVEGWLLENCGVILGICVGVAVVELLGMILSMCLCKSVVQEDYSKVPKY
ncbi:CD82 molecule b isoform X1 [Coregonus clupeaformis]|uniref:CD82 molecule b isoform X1 n=2 Tax=Coregonus clupeaformis TaxID=59861 RepID=UPI001BE0CFDE|nr:CD82 molecule b isoform X1 [Coregonus clupeaformis]